MDTNEEASGVNRPDYTVKMENGILVMTGPPEVIQAIINNALANMLRKQALRGRLR